MLEGVRVVDLTTDIAGPYCTKVLADAGADVIKVEPPDGDPLRRWRSGALFEFLNTSKRSVQGETDELAAAADILVTGAPVDARTRLWAANPALVVVTITPFGCDGPWAGRPAREFTLQAACGSTGQRGLPEQPPLAAGGRMGEWMTGTYAALGAMAALQGSPAQRAGRARRRGHARLHGRRRWSPTPRCSPRSRDGRTVRHGVEPSKCRPLSPHGRLLQRHHEQRPAVPRLPAHDRDGPISLDDPDLPPVPKRFAARRSSWPPSTGTRHTAHGRRGAR